MNPAFLASFLALCILGMLNAGYLIWRHHQPKPLVCPLNHDCSKVTESRWAHIFFFRNETLGFLFFLFMSMALAYTFFFPQFLVMLYLLILIGASFGLLFSVFLILVQVFAIKEYCFYCLISAGITLLLFLNSLAVYYGI